MCGASGVQGWPPGAPGIAVGSGTSACIREDCPRLRRIAGDPGRGTRRSPSTGSASDGTGRANRATQLPTTLAHRPRRGLAGPVARGKLSKRGRVALLVFDALAHELLLLATRPPRSIRVTTAGLQRVPSVAAQQKPRLPAPIADRCAFQKPLLAPVGPQKPFGAGGVRAQARPVRSQAVYLPPPYAGHVRICGLSPCVLPLALSAHGRPSRGARERPGLRVPCRFAWSPSWRKPRSRGSWSLSGETGDDAPETRRGKPSPRPRGTYPGGARRGSQAGRFGLRSPCPP